MRSTLTSRWELALMGQCTRDLCMEKKQQSKQCLPTKVVSSPVKQDAYFKKALLLEIKTMQKVQSQHIVRLIDVLESENYVYLILQYCDDGDLRILLKRHQSFPETEAIALIKQILQGFKELTRRGIIHRDLKPQNILLHKGQLKITDFGLAKIISDQEAMHSTSVGTPLYSCPQILKNQKYSSKCDIWSLGCIYCQLLTGEHPFRANSIYELHNKVLTQPPNLGKVTSRSHQFLINALMKHESDRLSWDQVFNHPIFTEAPKELQEDMSLQNILYQLRNDIYGDKQDLTTRFLQQEYNLQTDMHYEDFLPILICMFPSLCYEEVLQICHAVDLNHTEHFSILDFMHFLESKGIAVKMVDCLKVADLDDVHQKEERLIEHSRKAIKQILLRIDDDSFSVEPYFIAGVIDYEGFKQLLLKANNNPLTEEIVVAGFQMFDPEFKGISYKEFQRRLVKIAGPLKKKVSLKKGDYQPTVYEPLHK